MKAVEDIRRKPQGIPENGPLCERTTMPNLAHPIRASVDMRGLAWASVSLIVVVYALQWGEKFFVSLLLGIIIAYTLNPLVEWLERVRIPRAVGSSVVMLAVLGGSAVMVIPLR